jgi:hypothetical protein
MRLGAELGVRERQQPSGMDDDRQVARGGGYAYAESRRYKAFVGSVDRTDHPVEHARRRGRPREWACCGDCHVVMLAAGVDGGTVANAEPHYGKPPMSTPATRRTIEEVEGRNRGR